jgi:hypothetical protein
MNCTEIKINKNKLQSCLLGSICIMTGVLIAENKREGGMITYGRIIANSGIVFHLIGWMLIIYALIYSPQSEYAYVDLYKKRKKIISACVAMIGTAFVTYYPWLGPKSIFIGYILFVVSWYYFLRNIVSIKSYEDKYELTNKKLYSLCGVILVLCSMIVLTCNRKHNILNPAIEGVPVVYNHGLILLTIGWILISFGISSCGKSSVKKNKTTNTSRK